MHDVDALTEALEACDRFDATPSADERLADARARWQAAFASADDAGVEIPRLLSATASEAEDLDAEAASEALYWAAARLAAMVASGPEAFARRERAEQQVHERAQRRLRAFERTHPEVRPVDWFLRDLSPEERAQHARWRRWQQTHDRQWSKARRHAVVDITTRRPPGRRRHGRLSGPVRRSRRHRARSPSRPRRPDDGGDDPPSPGAGT